MTSKWALAALLLIPSLIGWGANTADAQFRYPGGPAPYPGAVNPAMFNAEYGQAPGPFAMMGHNAPCDCDTSGYANSAMIQSGGYGGGGYGGGECGGGYGCGGGCGEGSCEKQCLIRVTADALFLKMAQPTKQILVLDQNTGDPIISTSDMGFGSKPGVRFSADYNYCETRAIQVLYFGLQNFGSSVARTGDNNLAIPGDLGLATDDFFGADLMSVTYNAELNNAEGNFIQQSCWKGISFLGGFRYLELSEGFNIHTIDSDAEESDYNVRARNQLYGGQIGAQLCQRVGALDLLVQCKAGIFGNSAQQSSFLADNGNSFVLRNSSTSETDTSFVGEVNVSGRVALTSWLSLRGGYNIIWLNNVARAPNQLDFSDTPSSGTALVSNDDAILHGLHLGVEGTW